MERSLLVIGALAGLTAVGAGAFGAHALASRLDPKDLATFEVAVRYQVYHALALLVLGMVFHKRPSRAATGAAVCMLAGIVLFSGSLYGVTLGGWRWLGRVAPIGGLSLMLGWLLLIVAAFGLRAREPNTAG